MAIRHGARTALTFTGLLTDVSVSVLGGILTLCGAVGWFRQVLPHEHHEVMPVEAARACRAWFRRAK